MRREPRLPPLLTLVPVPPGGSVLERAAIGAGEGTLGAGDFLVRWNDAIAIALVLEPDVSRETCYSMFPLAEVAIGEALAAIAPPETQVQQTWMGELVVNGAIVGAVEGIIENAQESSWLVVGCRINHAPTQRANPGDDPTRSTLADELGPLDPVDLVEAIARHWTAWLHRWETEGWSRVAREWANRAVPEQTVEHEYGADRLLGTDDGGNAIVQTERGPITVPLASRWRPM